MDLTFKTINYDGELADFSEEELRELVGKFEQAEEANVAEFEKAVSAAEDTVDTSEYDEACETLVDEITDHENFDEVPVGEEILEDADFEDLREWREFVADDEGESESEQDGEFDDFGTRSPTETGDDTDFADDAVGEMSGVNL